MVRRSSMIQLYVYVYIYDYMACQLNSPGQTGQNSTICTIAKYLFQPWHEKRNMLCEWMVRSIGNQQIEMKLFGRCPPEFPGAPRNDLASTTHSHNDGCWAVALLLWCSGSWRNPGQLQVQAMPITSEFSQSALPWHTLNESLVPLKSKTYKTSSNACKDELPRQGLQHLS